MRACERYKFCRWFKEKKCTITDDTVGIILMDCNKFWESYFRRTIPIPYEFNKGINPIEMIDNLFGDNKWEPVKGISFAVGSKKKNAQLLMIRLI